MEDLDGRRPQSAIPSWPQVVPCVHRFRDDSGALWVGRAGNWLRIQTPVPADVDAVLGRLDGSRTCEQILRETPQPSRGLSADGAARIIEAMARKHLLRAGHPPPLTGAPQLLEETQARTLEFLSLFETASASRYDFLSRLQQARVALVGVGGLGSWLLTTLTSLGVGEIVIIDHDLVELHNLTRQIIYRPEDVGSAKVDAAVSRMGPFRPLTKLHPVHTRIEAPSDLETVLAQATCDLVAVAADWPPRRIGSIVSRACSRQGVASIYGSTSLRSTSVGPLAVPGRASCAECLWRHRLERPGGTQLDQAIRHPADAAQGIPAISPIPALTAQIMAWEIVCYLTGIQRPATVDGLIRLDLDNWRTRRFPLRRHPSCSACAEAMPVTRTLARPAPPPGGAEDIGAASPRNGAPELPVPKQDTLVRWQPRVVCAEDEAGDLHIQDLRDRHLVVRRAAPAQVHMCQSLYRPASVRDLIDSALAQHPGTVAGAALQLVHQLARRGLLQMFPSPGQDHDTNPLYERQLSYLGVFEREPGDRHRAQERLRASTVTVVGVGGVGSSTVQHLTAMGVGTLVLVDGDRVERSNLNRQSLYAEADIGRLKVEVAERELSALNPQVVVRPVVQTITSRHELEEVLTGSDFFILTADKPPVLLRRWASDAAMNLGLPWIQGSVDAYLLQLGPVYVPGRTPCFRCREIAAESTTGPAYGRARAEADSDPPLIAPACAMVASGLALEAVVRLSGIRNSELEGAYVTIDLRNWRAQEVRLQRHPNCPACAAVRDGRPVDASLSHRGR